MATAITISLDDETEHSLDILTRGGHTRSEAIREAIVEAARRRERATEMRRTILRMNLGAPDGINVAGELARER